MTVPWTGRSEPMMPNVTNGEIEELATVSTGTAELDAYKDGDEAYGD